MLFVIDDSSETRLLQANLLRNFPTFMSALDGTAAGFPTFTSRSSRPTWAPGDGSIAGCDATGGKNGIFQYTAARHLHGDRPRCPARRSSPTPAASRNYTGNIADVFTCIAALGESGCGFEHQLAAVARALGADGQPAPAENQGFLRADAFLFIVIVTNEDDCSAPPGSGLFDTTATPTLASPLGPVRRTSAATSSATSATAPSRRAWRRTASARR